jgi:hypothetical protein
MTLHNHRSMNLSPPQLGRGYLPLGALRPAVLPGFFSKAWTCIDMTGFSCHAALLEFV